MKFWEMTLNQNGVNTYCNYCSNMSPICYDTTLVKFSSALADWKAWTMFGENVMLMVSSSVERFSVFFNFFIDQAH